MMYGLLFFMALNHGVTTENYDKIEFGMSRPQVVKILGRESNAYDADKRKARLLSRPRPGGVWLLMEIEGDGDTWENGDLQVWVLFNADGQVTGKGMGKWGRK